MKVLFIFDAWVEIDRIDRLSLSSGDTIYLFPLTSKGYMKSILLDKIKAAGCDVDVIPVAKLINSVADNLRDRYIRFVAELPESVRYRDKNLKEYFAIDMYTTLWWFSLISEKNTYKSDTFNRLVQFDSIVSLIEHKNIEKIIFWCKSNKLEEALSEYALLNSIEFKTLPIRVSDTLKKYILKFRIMPYFCNFLLLVNFAVQLFPRIYRIKRKMSSLKRNLTAPRGPFLFITPYPNFDISLAQKGIFRNKYYTGLQETLEAEGQDIISVFMYIENNTISFRESLEYAEKFIKKGYTIFFLDEFNSVFNQIRALWIMLKNSLRFFKIEKDIAKMHTFGNYNFYQLFKDDWYLSFAGHVGYSGILYYYMFMALLKKVKAKKCLYLWEMHAWEKAMISARAAICSRMPLYGYQFATVPRMLLNLFNDPIEINDNGAYAMPRPEKVISNGQRGYNYIKESGWPEETVSIVEAVRYDHLKECLRSRYSRKRDAVLLAFSISPYESSSILSVACESLRGLKDIELWLKPHPFLQTEKVFELAGLRKENSPFQIKNRPIEELLSEARILIVGESGVSLEALAYGCNVIIVDVPEWINMSTLKDVKADIVRFISLPEGLRQAVIEIFNEGYDPDKNALEAERIIGDYFYFNQGSNIPERFLKLLKEIA